MIKKILCSILIVIVLFITVGCNLKKGSNNNSKNSNEVVKTVKVIIDETEYTINLEENETAKSFVNYLPQELTMK